MIDQIERERRRVVRLAEGLINYTNTTDDVARIMPCTEDEARTWNAQYAMTTAQNEVLTWQLVKRSCMVVDQRRKEVLYWNPYNTPAPYRIISYKGL